MLSPHCTLSVILVKRVSKEPASHVIPKCTLSVVLVKRVSKEAVSHAIHTLHIVCSIS